MKVDRGSLVWLEYEAFLDSGELIDSSGENGPLRIHVGQWSLLPGLGEKLVGLAQGDERLAFHSRLAEDLVNLGFVQVYLKLMIDGVASAAFSANTLPPLPRPEISYKDEILHTSRKEYAHPRVEVEKQISEWSAAMFGTGPSVYHQNAPRQFTRSINNFSQTEPRRFEYQGPPSNRRNFDAPPPRKPVPVQEHPVSLSEALKTGPVDFKGRPIEQKNIEQKAKNKPVVDTNDLRQTLEGILSKENEKKDPNNPK